MTRTCLILDADTRVLRTSCVRQ